MRIKHTILLAAMILCAITLKAQKAENFLAAVGSPPNPKVAVSWNRYNDYTAITDICKKLAAAYPNLARIYGQIISRQRALGNDNYRSKNRQLG